MLSSTLLTPNVNLMYPVMMQYRPGTDLILMMSSRSNISPFKITIGCLAICFWAAYVYTHMSSQFKCELIFKQRYHSFTFHIDRRWYILIHSTTCILSYVVSNSVHNCHMINFNVHISPHLINENTML